MNDQDRIARLEREVDTLREAARILASLCLNLHHGKEPLQLYAVSVGHEPRPITLTAIPDEVYDRLDALLADPEPEADQT